MARPAITAALVLAAVVDVASAAPAAAEKPIYFTVGPDGVPVISDVKAEGSVRWRPGRLDEVLWRQTNTPHLGLGVLGADDVDDDVDAPAVPASIRALAEAAAAKHDVPLSLLLAVIGVESGYDARAVSRAGAVGLMQLMPATAADLGVDPAIPAQNVDGGARYLAWLLRTFGSDELALAAYNAGPGTVRRAGGVPDYPETRRYVARVLGLSRALR